jgi:predicted nucleic-acid-binding protein
VIGLDTNIVLRIFDRTDPKQSAAVDRLLKKSEDRFLLAPIVLSEFAWTLARTYKQSRQVVAQHLHLLLDAPEFVVPFHREATAAAHRYEQGPADFADYFIAEMNNTLGCSTTLTFDEAAAEDDHYTLLKV